MINELNQYHPGTMILNFLKNSVKKYTFVSFFWDSVLNLKHFS